MLVTLGTSAVAYADHPSVDFGPGSSGSVSAISATTLPEGATAFGLRAQYVKSERLSDEELRRRAGEHGHGGGAAVNTVGQHGDSSGIGDLSVLGKYRWTGDHRHGGFQSALLFGVSLPTGETREKDAQGERFEAEHQAGSGSWDPLLGVALTRSLGAVSLDASLLYTFSTEGAQDTELGDRMSYNAGISYRMGGEDHHHEGRSSPHGHDAWHAILELNGEWEGKQSIGGVTEAESGGNVVYLSPGLRFVSSGGWSDVLSVGFPIAQHIRLSHPENDYRLIAGFSRAL